MTEWTPERREKQREVAQRLVQEGKFGGAGRGQGRPRKPRASELIADQVANDAQAIYDRFIEIVRHGKDANSIAAGNSLLTIEEKERKLELEEEQQIEEMHRNDLLALVWNQIKELGTDGEFGFTVDEAEFAEIEERRTPELGEKSESSTRTE